MIVEDRETLSGSSYAAERHNFVRESNTSSNISLAENSKAPYRGKGLSTEPPVAATKTRKNRRCEFEGCTKSARPASSFCVGHGGGIRCSFEGCTKSARSGSSFCVAHGGGKRCSQEGCVKSARPASAFCVAHGGGKRCEFKNCVQFVKPGANFCSMHE